MGIFFFFLSSKVHKKLVKIRIMYISDKFTNGHFRGHILGKTIGLGNRCINHCPDKWILSLIPIDCWEICSEQLKCFPVISTTMSLGELNSKLQPRSTNFGQDISFKTSWINTICFTDSKCALMKTYCRTPDWQSSLVYWLENLEGSIFA